MTPSFSVVSNNNNNNVCVSEWEEPFANMLDRARAAFQRAGVPECEKKTLPEAAEGWGVVVQA